MSADRPRARTAPAALPVDIERLRAEFPDLTDEDLKAYVSVTRRVLGDPATRAKAMRDLMERARQAREKADAGRRLSEDDERLVRYLEALGKMQRSTVR